MKDTKNEIKLKIKYIIIFSVLIANTIVLVSIFGRYVVNKTKGHFERTKAFFFYSDKLEEENPYYPCVSARGFCFMNGIDIDGVALKIR